MPSYPELSQSIKPSSILTGLLLAKNRMTVCLGGGGLCTLVRDSFHAMVTWEVYAVSVSFVSIHAADVSLDMN